jgi:hypothetical protein
MEDVKGDASFPGNTKKLRVFVSDIDFDHASPTQAVKKQDLDISTDGTLSTKVIDGLQNDPSIPYHFRVGVLDAANNVYGFVSDTNIQNIGGCTTPADVDFKDACKYHAVPDAVFGLLQKDLNCFVATAAYGSSMEPKIQIFRDFRHKFLLTNEWGKAFVMKYYQWGPYAAQWIAQHE